MAEKDMEKEFEERWLELQLLIQFTAVLEAMCDKGIISREEVEKKHIEIREKVLEQWHLRS